jgi:S-formylglutathione hydrolase FrmB
MVRARMTRSRLLLLACLFVAGTHAALGQTPAPARSGELLELKVPAPSLAGNKLHDPTEQPIVMYLPPGYKSDTGKRYPVIYLLHGFAGNIHHWTTNGYQGLNLQPVMDEFIRAGKIGEVIVVSVNGNNAFTGSFYTNSSTTGGWEDFLVNDVVGFVDSHYRTIARPESRGIAGHSMGGYAAIMTGLKHPDRFSAVYALSPCCGAFVGDLTSENPVWKRTLSLTSVDQLSKDPQTLEDFWTIVQVAISAAFSPNPSRPPFYADFPYRLENGNLLANPDVIARWKAKMPVELAKSNAANLKKLRGFYMDYGENEDFTHIRQATRELSDELAAADVPYGFEIYANGDHGNLIRQRFETRALPFFAERLAFKP